MSRPHARAATLGIALGAVACGRAPEPDERSEYLDLYLDDGIEVCRGQLDAYDNFIERIFDFWTGDDPGEFHGTVYVLTEAPPECGENLGCTVNDTAWLSRGLGEYHELAHLMHLAVDGGSSAVLQEGTAEALGPLYAHSYSTDELAA